ncbi:MAG: hypothetical protein GXO35_08795 [Gammaproteobacteria bacterium]|nr:hypothetical protein [Gammaproteobacteria bacterium]
MNHDKPIRPAVKYFFKHLERRSATLKIEREREKLAHQEIPFDEVEQFFRQILYQNIFIHTVGQNGKHESTILSKAIFSMNSVVRIYYSTSFDENNSGFIRIRPDMEEQLIIVERMHGHRAEPELLYASKRQCHVVRFLVRWLLRRIDWSKTKLENLDLYKRHLLQEQQEEEARQAEALARQEEEEIRLAFEKHAKDHPKQIHS